MTDLLPVLQLILAIGNICIMLYALYKFMRKPHDSLESKVNMLEHDVAEMKDRLLRGNDRFREQEETNQVLIHSILALIEFEIQYCIEEKHQISKGLEEAKVRLHNYLSKR